MHVDEDLVIAYMSGSLEPAQVDGIRAHVDTCPDCLALVVCAVKQRDPGMLPTLPVGVGALGSDPRPSSRTILAPGTTIGPYEIERLLGAGGMGVVYMARDPRLDRSIALKLIRRGLGEHRDELVERLRRESKALARLSHPNVTVVYELGAADDEIYVAMEYVAGTNLRTWLTESRTPREILDVFARAGVGLAAVHDAGLVHRDFKPDNVLLGETGTIKVTDFGLARISEHAPAIESGELDDDGLTRTGGILGTPAYMAPEQFRGGVIDARTDQFAFCIALYEALYGERPFAGRTVDELRTAVLGGRVEAARTTKVPGRVRRALLRGLAVDPEARFGSMPALLAALAPRRGRITIAIAGVAVVAIVALVASIAMTTPAPGPCQSAAAEIGEVWNVARRVTVQHSFYATRSPGVAQAWTAVEHGIDAFTTAWATMHDSACAATRVHRQQSEAVLDLRMACLERRRSQLDALLSVFSHADAGTIAHANEALAALGDVRPCADAGALGRRVPLPSDPEARRRYDAQRARIDSASALVDVARFKDATPTLETILGEVHVADFPALEAEAQLLYGKALVEQGEVAKAEQELFHAHVLAQAARADDLVADAAMALAHVVGYRQDRTADGLRWIDQAAAALTAKGGDDLRSARLATIRANILERAGRLREAEKASRAALEIATHHVPGGVLEAEVLDALGSNLSQQGKFDAAVPMLEKALAIRERVFGAVHSLTASTRMNLANALATTHHYREALDQFHQALAADEVLFGHDGYELSTVLGNMGQMLQEQGTPRDARPLLERALAIREHALGPDDPAVARSLVNLGYVHLDEHAYADALARFTRADAILVPALGEDHPARFDALEGIGLATIGLGAPAKAIEPLELGLRLREKHPSDPVELASAQANLGRALWASKRDRVRGGKLAAGARKILADAGEERAVAEIDDWLKR